MTGQVQTPAEAHEATVRAATDAAGADPAAALTPDVLGALAALDRPETAVLFAQLVDGLGVAAPRVLTKGVIGRALEPYRAPKPDRRRKRQRQNQPQPCEPYELNGNAGPSGQDPSQTLRQHPPDPTADGPDDGLDDPPDDGELGQNEVADLIAVELRDRLGWDGAAGVWFERAEPGAPFRQHDEPLTVWRTIKTACARHRRRFAAGFVDGVERFVRAELVVPAWDESRHLLPLENGVLDLATGVRRDYVAADRFNWQLPYRHDPSARCPLIDRTIRRMVGGDPDLERFLLAWLVVVLLGRADVQAFVELVGRRQHGQVDVPAARDVPRRRGEHRGDRRRPAREQQLRDGDALRQAPHPRDRLGPVPRRRRHAQGDHPGATRSGSSARTSSSAGPTSTAGS